MIRIRLIAVLALFTVNSLSAQTEYKAFENYFMTGIGDRLLAFSTDGMHLLDEEYREIWHGKYKRMWNFVPVYELKEDWDYAYDVSDDDDIYQVYSLTGDVKEYKFDRKTIMAYFEKSGFEFSGDYRVHRIGMFVVDGDLYAVHMVRSKSSFAYGLVTFDGDSKMMSFKRLRDIAGDGKELETAPLRDLGKMPYHSFGEFISGGKDGFVMAKKNWKKDGTTTVYYFDLDGSLSDKVVLSVPEQIEIAKMSYASLSSYPWGGVHVENPYNIEMTKGTQVGLGTMYYYDEKIYYLGFYCDNVKETAKENYYEPTNSIYVLCYNKDGSLDWWNRTMTKDFFDNTQKSDRKDLITYALFEYKGDIHLSLFSYRHLGYHDFTLGNKGEIFYNQTFPILSQNGSDETIDLNVKDFYYTFLKFPKFFADNKIEELESDYYPASTSNFIYFYQYTGKYTLRYKP